MSLNTTLILDILANYQKSQNPGALLATLPLHYNKTLVWPTGSGADLANKVFSDTRTLAASASESLDLSGVLTDVFGVVLAFTKVNALMIAADPANTNNVNVGGAASNGFITPFGDPTDIVVVRPGGVFLAIARDATAYAVTAATGDLLKIANSGSGTGVNYDVVIIGS